MGKPTDQSSHVMYIVARDHYLMSLLKEGTITQEQFEKMERFLYDRFQIASIRLDEPFDAPAPIESIEADQTTQKSKSMRPETPKPLLAKEPEPVSLTDFVRQCSEESPGHVIQSWMRDRSTMEFLSLWESEHNPDFNREGCTALLDMQRTPSFTMTPKKWIEQTNAKGLISRPGKNWGTYAHPVIACEFTLSYEVYAMSSLGKKVTVLPATKELLDVPKRSGILRVAAYCRVSTRKSEQESSYEAQVDYYTQRIRQNPDWICVGIFADQGMSGVSADKRKEFQKMMRACRAGKIDMVITKSISRFCRNTLDGLEYIRELTTLGVDVYFEKENIHTLYLNNEMLLTFLMSQAQSESESLSSNVKWGHRKNFKDGKVYYQYENFLGYRKGEDGQPEVDPEQALIVRRIFSRYLMGDSVQKICKDLMADEIKAAKGGKRWHSSVIQSMLQNEKYIGDALLQKTYIADLFTGQSKKNTGELPQYYVHECHPAIVDRETFQKVQEEMARRSSLPARSGQTKTDRGRYSGKYALNEILICGICGRQHKRVLWMPNGERHYVWRCITRMENGKYACGSPAVGETVLHQAIVSSMDRLIDGEKLSTALLAAAELVDDPKGAVRSRVEQLLDDCGAGLKEYSDVCTRQLIRKITVVDENSFEIKYRCRE